MRHLTSVIALALASCAHSNSDTREDTRDRYDDLMRRAGDVPCATPVGCDAAAFACNANRAALQSKPREALTWYEASLACQRDGDVERRAFMAACEAGDTPLARKYFPTMTIEPEKRSLIRDACMSFGVDPG